LTVSDGKLTGSDQIIVTVISANSPPTAPVVAISPASPLTTNNLVCNIVTPSYDANSDPVTYSYEWSKNGILQNGLTSNSVSASLTSRGNIWRCKVTPRDSFGYGAPGYSQVSIGNTAPVANAGLDQNVIIKKLVTLSASGSSDADNDALSFKWTKISGPSVTLSKSTTAKPTFTPTTEGSYVFRVTVSDGTAFSSDDVIVTASKSVTYKMHVQSINLTLSQQYSGRYTSATAKVLIYDANDKAVSGAVVSGHWITTSTSYKKASANSSGLASFTSSILSYPPHGTTFTFVIDSITKSGWVYDSSSNTVGSGSITVP
jgi:hypothetical protein